MMRLAIGMLVLLWAGSGVAGPSLSLEPNAIESLDRPMQVTVTWPEAQKPTLIRLRILADCDGDGAPDEQDAPCKGRGKAVLWDVARTIQAGLFEEKISLHELSPGHGKLWFFMFGPAGEREYEIFFLPGSRCSVWQALLNEFRSGATCRLGLAAAWEQLMGPADERPEAILEVRRLEVTGTPAPRPVPGTRGATGVAWDGQDLLVTRAGGDGTADKAGLYRVGAAGPKLLWPAPAGKTPVAPYSLGKGRFLLGLEPDVVKDGVITELVILDGGKIVRRMPLQRSVHQILGMKGDRVILLSRFGGKPEVVLCDLGQGRETKLGHDGPLLDGLLRAPSGDMTVYAQINRATKDWDLWITEENIRRPLVQRPEHDLMPAWRPDGGQVAYLAEVTKDAPSGAARGAGP